MKKKKGPGGRPTDYDPSYCEMLVMHMKRGKGYNSFASTLDLSIQTLYDWEKAHPEFLEAKKRGFEHCYTWWEEAGQDGLYGQTFKDADGMTVTKSINSAIWIFNMKNRFGWRDKQPDEVASGKVPEIKVNIKDYTGKKK